MNHCVYTAGGEMQCDNVEHFSNGVVRLNNGQRVNVWRDTSDPWNNCQCTPIPGSDVSVSCRCYWGRYPPFAVPRECRNNPNSYIYTDIPAGRMKCAHIRRRGIF